MTLKVLLYFVAPTLIIKAFGQYRVIFAVSLMAAHSLPLPRLPHSNNLARNHPGLTPAINSLH